MMSCFFGPNLTNSMLTGISADGQLTPATTVSNFDPASPTIIRNKSICPAFVFCLLKKENISFLREALVTIKDFCLF